MEGVKAETLVHVMLRFQKKGGGRKKCIVVPCLNVTFLH